MIYPVNYMLDSDIRNCFSYQTRFLGAPRFGSRPISWYQKDQVDMHDNIVDRARHLGVTGQFEVVFTEGSLWAKISGWRIRLGSGEYFRRRRD